MPRLTFLLLSILIFACAGKQVKNDLESELNSLLENRFKSDEPGASILIMKGEDIAFQNNYGLADLGSGQEITENTVFNTGSVSKTFVSNGILILQERGLLSLDDTIDKYFDDFDSVEIARNITIRHLLSHTSGLPDLRKVSENREFYLTAKDVENFEPLKRTRRLNFETGARFQYSNPAYNGLALIIEKVTGQPWQDFIKNEIFRPAGMQDSKITDGSHPETGVAHAYVRNEQGDFEENDYGEVPTFAAAGNGGIWSSVMDLARYEKALQTHIFLTGETINESRTIFRPDNWSDGDDPFVGYSWFLGENSLFEESDFNVDMVYHTGSQGGFRAIYLVIPEKKIHFIGLFNRPVDDFREMIKECLEVLERREWLD